MENNIPSEKEVLDLTKVTKKDEQTINILPPALLAAKALNKKNSIGTIEVHLPILNVKVKCLAMSNVDDLTIKTISGSMSAYSDLNFKLLYKHLEFPENHSIVDYESFLYYCTEADFRAALYGVMMATFKTLEESKFQCKNKTCPNPDETKVFNASVKISEIQIEFKKEPYVSINGDHTKDIFIAQNEILTINYKFDNIKNKINYFSIKSNEEIRNNILSYGSMIPKNEMVINYIDSIEVLSDEQIYKISSPQDILLFLQALDLTSKEELEKLNEKYINYIDSWIPDFKTEVECPHCKTKTKWEGLDIYVEFFRKFTTLFQ